MIYCACGCGTKILPFDKRGRKRIFKNGHSSKKFNSIIDIIMNIELIDTNCWIWKGGTNRSGYAYLNIKGKKYLVHRLIYSYTYDKNIDDVILCHKCDNPLCVNPEHLFEGTDMDNVHDSIKKNRRPGTCLSEEDVLEMRKLYYTGYYSQTNIALKFKISKSYARKVLLHLRRNNIR